MSIWEILKPPTEEQSIAIRNALKETDLKLENNLKLLEDWISHQDYLPQNYDKRVLSAYIRGAKHTIEDAKKKIRQYFIARSENPDLFAKRILTIDEDLKATTFMYSVTMPDITPEGYRITITKVFNNDIDLFDPLKLLRLAALICELRCHEENFLAGEIVILDCSLVTAAIAVKMLSSQLKKIIVVVQEAFPVLIKQVHLITDQSIILNGANFFKQFMKEKIRNRFHVHKTHDTLSNFINREYLPLDYGGSQLSLEELNEKWTKVIGDYKELFERIDRVNLRGSIPKNLVSNFETIEGEFHVEGSFRKLNID